MARITNIQLEHSPDTGSWSRAPPTSFLSLTAGQEAALRAYLDSALLSLERDERKHRLGPLSSLLSRLTPVLHAILQLPAREPWADTRVAYFLRYTSSAARYITTLPLLTIPPGVEDDAEACAAIEAEAGDTMQAVIDLLVEIGRGWVAVLEGKGWVAPPCPPSPSNPHLPTPPQSSQEGAGGDGERQEVEDAKGAGDEEEAQGEGEVRGEAVMVEGGSLVDQTSRVRLKSIVTLARELVLAWARPYGDFGGEVMGPEGDEGVEHTRGESEGWERHIVNMWTDVLQELKRQTPPDEETI